MTIGPLGIIPPPKLQFFVPGTAVPLAGGLLFTYAAGTTTKQDTYVNDSQTPNTNPIVLDANGQCVCFVDTTLSYDFTLSPPTDTDPPTNPFWTVGSIGFEEMTAAFAPLDSPAFTGTPTAPTPSLGDSSENIATTQFVQETITTGLVNAALTGTPTAPTAAPGTLTTQVATTAFVGAEITRAPQMMVFTSSSSFTIPAGVTRVKLKAWAGGGGGGAGTATIGSGGGGGGGGHTEGLYTVTPAGALVITVGSGGTGSSTSSAGAAGGATSVTGMASGSCATTAGGGGSSSGSGGGAAGGGGSGSGGLLNVSGQGGGAGYSIGSAGVGGNGGGSFCAPCTGPSASAGGQIGIFPGGGGGGGGAVNGGGNGAGGLVIIEWLAP